MDTGISLNNLWARSSDAHCIACCKNFRLFTSLSISYHGRFFQSFCPVLRKTALCGTFRQFFLLFYTPTPAYEVVGFSHSQGLVKPMTQEELMVQSGPSRWSPESFFLDMIDKICLKLFFQNIELLVSMQNLFWRWSRNTPDSSKQNAFHVCIGINRKVLIDESAVRDR